MCDTATQEIISDTVKDFVQQGKMFTALDITRYVQANNGVQYRHNDIKNEIHKVYADGGMSTHTRTLITINGIPVKVWLYHSVSDDPNTYQSQYATTSSVVTVPPLTVPTTQLTITQPAPVANVNATSSYSIDKRERLWIPKDFVKNVGKPGERVDVVKVGSGNGSSLTVLASGSNSSGSKITDYLIDRHGNIAISRVCLAEISLKPSYSIMCINNTVVIN